MSDVSAISMDASAQQEQFAAPRWYAVPRAWLAMLIGFAIGCVDFWLMGWVGVKAIRGTQDVTLWVILYYAVNLAVMAFVLGYASAARTKLRLQAEMIKAQYEALQESQRLAAENEKLATIGRLAACVAHEVRNPLGVIRTSASMMMEDFSEDDDRWRAGEFICEEVIRLDAFCTALLNFSRPLCLEKRPVPIVEVLHSVQRQIASTWEGADEGQFAIEISLPSLVVQVDQELLTQACLGLTDNARQAAGVTGHVVMRVGQSDKASLCLEIADDGAGVAPGMEQKIFEPFFTTKASGTGLGLAMAARIVEAHEGRLEVVPGGGVGPQGQGACFRVHLPIAEEQAR